MAGKEPPKAAGWARGPINTSIEAVARKAATDYYRSHIRVTTRDAIKAAQHHDFEAVQAIYAALMEWFMRHPDAFNA